MLIKLCTNISFSIRGILILHTDQGHSDYYTLLKINFKNGLVLEMCCRNVCPSLKLQQEKNEKKICVLFGQNNPGKIVPFVVTIGSQCFCLFSLCHDHQVITTDLLPHNNGRHVSSLPSPSVRVPQMGSPRWTGRSPHTGLSDRVYGGLCGRSSHDADLTSSPEDSTGPGDKGRGQWALRSETTGPVLSAAVVRTMDSSECVHVRVPRRVSDFPSAAHGPEHVILSR